MNLIKSMYKRKLTMYFFIIGFMLAILTFSLGTSALEANKKEMSKINSKENIMINIYNSNDMKLENIVGIASNNNIDLKVSNNIIMEDSSNFNMVTQLTGEELNINGEFIDGSNFTNDELEGNEMKAIVTEDLKDKKIEYTDVITKQTITLKTVATVNGNNSDVYVPRGTFMNLFGNESLDRFTILVNGSESDINKFKVELRNEVSKFSKEGQVEEMTNDINDMSFQGRNLYIIAIAIFLITILNSINICGLWVKDRIKEISIRKAIGANNFNIFNLMFGELLIISIFSAICALAIQFILSMLSDGKLAGIPIELSMKNFIVATMFAVGAALLSALPSVIHLIKIEPAETLKEE